MTYSIKIKGPNGETIHELLLVCSNCLAKTFCFLPAIGHLVMPKFFSAKYMFAMATTKGHRKNLKKTYTFTHQIKTSYYLGQ